MSEKQIATPIQFMIAGAVFMEPEEGDRRLKLGTVNHFMPGDPRADEFGMVEMPGYLLQEYGPRYDKDGFELCGGGVWRTIGHVDNYPALLCELPEHVCAALAKAGVA